MDGDLREPGLDQFIIPPTAPRGLAACLADTESQVSDYVDEEVVPNLSVLYAGASARYAGVLTLFVIPIAIVGNILRIMTLVLLTYFFGDAVAQGFAHFTAGIFLFAIALVLVFLTDNLLARILPKSWQEAT